MCLTLRCKWCKGIVQVPELGSAVRERIALLRATDSLRAVHVLAEETGWDMREAKRTVLHLTETRGVCWFHHCRSALPQRECLCPVCDRVNIDWFPDATSE